MIRFFSRPDRARHTWDRLFRCAKPEATPSPSDLVARKRLGSTFSQLWVFAAAHKRLIVLVLLLTLIAEAMTVVIPILVGYVFDHVLSEKRMDLLNLFGPAMLAFVAVLSLVQYSNRRLLTVLGVLIIRDMRLRIHSHLLSHSVRFIEAFQVGRIVARVINDTESIRSMLHTVLMRIVSNGLRLVLVVGSMFWMDWRLTLISCGFLPFFAYRMEKLIKRLKPASKELAEDNARLMARTGETFGGIRLVKVFGRERWEHLRFLRRIHVLLRKRLAIRNTHYKILSVWEFASWTGLVLLVWYGGHRVLDGQLRLGHLIAFYGLLGMLTMPISVILNSLEIVLMAAASLERIHEVLLTPPEIRDLPDARIVGRIKGRVSFDRVHFVYPAREGGGPQDAPETLADICLEAEPGQTIALVGPSGAGKTTLALLLARIYDVTEGTIRVDGMDIRDYQLRAYRRNLAVVLQESILFEGTVRENIAYAKPDATVSEIEEAARMAQAWGFIEKLPAGLETLVGERGATLSGGQRQRVAIARAFLADPRILILDEATSALDSQSESLVQEALKELLKNRTTFVIAHRLSTVVGADLIVAMQNGRIVERGRHEELIQRDGLYARLYHEQFADILKAEGRSSPSIPEVAPGLGEVVPSRGPVPVGPQVGDHGGGQDLEAALSNDILKKPQEPDVKKPGNEE